MAAAGARHFLPGEAAVHGAVIVAVFAHGIALQVVDEPKVADGDVAHVEHLRPGDAAVGGAVNSAKHRSACHDVREGIEAPRAADGHVGAVEWHARSEAIGRAGEAAAAAAETSGTARREVDAQPAVACLAPMLSAVGGAQQAIFIATGSFPADGHAHLVVHEAHLVELGVPGAFVGDGPRYAHVAAALDAAVGAEDAAPAGGKRHALVVAAAHLLHGPRKAGIGAAHHAAPGSAGHQRVALHGHVEQAVGGGRGDGIPGGAAIGGADHLTTVAHAHADLVIVEMEILDQHQLVERT